jgi:site-specific recombinase XerD
VCKAAGITGARIHDLRHSFASLLVSGGVSLPMIGAMLGHTQVQTTQRYAHLYDEPLRAAADHVGKAIDRAGKKNSPGANGKSA